MHRPSFEVRHTARHHLVVALLVGLFVVSAAGGAVAQETPTLPDLSSTERQKLHEGEVLVDLEQSESVDRGVVIGIVQEDISEVTPPIARCWEYGEWRDNLRDTTFEEKIDDNNLVCGGTANVPFPIRDRHGNFDVHNRTETLDGTRAFVSSFEYIEGSGNLEDMYGYWVAYRYGENDEHTMVKHVLNVDIGTWLPGPIVRWATGKTLPNTILGIRNRITDGVSEPRYWNDHDYE